MPSREDILLGRVKDSINISTKSGDGKNGKDDVDCEFYSPLKFVELLAEGQTVALEMLYAPLSHVIELDPLLWPIYIYLRDNREMFLSKNINSFFGYAKKQAGKYGVKGSRLAAVDWAIAELQALADNSEHKRLGSYSELINEKVESYYSICDKNEDAKKLISLYPVEQISHGKPTSSIMHLEVCGRKIPFTVTMKEALAVLGRIKSNYGVRAQQAKENMGVDFKSCSHALRVAGQCIELMDTHKMTFPRPDADFLLKVKKGEIPYTEVSALIEEKMDEITAAAARATLPEKCDKEKLLKYVALCYDEYSR
jgi:hypothetical protein